MDENLTTQQASQLASIWETPPHAPCCPWYDLGQYGLPNVNWCEASLCSWVAEPANTWSNLGYIIAMLALAWQLRRWRITQPVLRLFPVAALLVGLSSGIYHASVTFVLQVFDFTGMYLFLFLPFFLHAVRLGKVSEGRFKYGYFGSVLGATFVTWVLGKFTSFPIQLLIILNILALFTMEILVYRRAVREGRGYSLRWLGITFGVLIAAFGASFVDAKRIICDPDAHGLFSQGHAIWHWLTALALTTSMAHYRQFDQAHSSDKPG